MIHVLLHDPKQIMTILTSLIMILQLIVVFYTSITIFKAYSKYEHEPLDVIRQLQLSKLIRLIV